MTKFIVLVALLLLGFAFVTYRGDGPLGEPRQDLYLKQLSNDDGIPAQIREDYRRRNNTIGAGVLVAASLGLLGGLFLYRNRLGHSKESFEPKADPSPEL